jgi:DNA-binding NtrC family response regulator
VRGLIGELAVLALREREDDIPELVHRLVRRHAARHRVRCRGVTAEALAVLEGYTWPGNVRELEQTVSRGVIFAGDGYIKPEHLELRELHDGRVAPDGDELMGGGLSYRQRDVLRLAVARGMIRRRDVVGRFGISREAAHADLALLVRAGLLFRSGAGRGSRSALARIG